MDRTVAVVLDANMFGAGAPTASQLAELQTLVTHGHRVVIPEPVLHELAAHVRAALAKATADLRALGHLEIVSQMNRAADSIFELLRSLFVNHGITIFSAEPKLYKLAVEAQIYGTPPAGRKKDVTTGAVDYLVLVCAELLVKQGFEVRVATNDSALAAAVGGTPSIAVLRSFSEQ